MIETPERYAWAKQRDPKNRNEVIGDPVPVVKGKESWAVANGYRLLEGDDERAAIAWAKGEAPPAPIEPAALPDNPPPDVQATGVKTTVNKNAKKKAAAPATT